MNPRYLWGTIKRTKNNTLSESQKEKKKVNGKRLLEKIMANKCPDLTKDLNL